MNVIEKLNSIDAKDLKNIDVNQVKDWAKKSPDNLIKILLILLTLFVTIYIYRDSKTNEANLSQKVKLLGEKLNADKNSKALKEARNQFVNEFPKSLTSNNLADRLAEIATNNNIRVEAFSPAKKLDYKYMFLTSVDINISTDDYRNVVSFIEDIEKADYAIRLESFSSRIGQNKSRTRRQAQTNTDNEEPGIAATITISAIELNKDLQ